MTELSIVYAGQILDLYNLVVLVVINCVGRIIFDINSLTRLTCGWQIVVIRKSEGGYPSPQDADRQPARSGEDSLSIEERNYT